MAAPCGRFSPPSAPAPVGSSVTEAGMLYTAQCQKPEPVGASGSWMVTAKLLVSAGYPDHDRCGETSAPPPPAPQWSRASGRPSATSVLDRVNNGTAPKRSRGSTAIATGYARAAGSAVGA